MQKESKRNIKCFYIDIFISVYFYHFVLSVLMRPYPPNSKQFLHNSPFRNFSSDSMLIRKFLPAHTLIALPRFTQRRRVSQVLAHPGSFSLSSFTAFGNVRMIAIILLLSLRLLGNHSSSSITVAAIRASKASLSGSSPKGLLGVSTTSCLSTMP